jgi:hypothetical protein
VGLGDGEGEGEGDEEGDADTSGDEAGEGEGCWARSDAARMAKIKRARKIMERQCPLCVAFGQSGFCSPLDRQVFVLGRGRRRVRSRRARVLR